MSVISLDGSVQSQGIKVSVRDWLDMGSEGWSKTPEVVKAAAYQAAKVTGWQDAGLLKIMLDNWYPRIDEDSAKFTLETLQDLAQKYPLGVEEVYKDENPQPVFKIKGCDKTIPFPEKT